MSSARPTSASVATGWRRTRNVDCAKGGIAPAGPVGASARNERPRGARPVVRVVTGHMAPGGAAGRVDADAEGAHAVDASRYAGSVVRSSVRWVRDGTLVT